MRMILMMLLPLPLICWLQAQLLLVLLLLELGLVLTCAFGCCCGLDLHGYLFLKCTFVSDFRLDPLLCLQCSCPSFGDFGLFERWLCHLRIAIGRRCFAWVMYTWRCTLDVAGRDLLLASACLPIGPHFLDLLLRILMLLNAWFGFLEDDVSVDLLL